jgi:DNA topoisomerase-1
MGGAPKIEINEKCPDCESPMALKFGRRGRFLACTAYPKCKKTMPAKDIEMPVEESDELCEDCSKPMLIKYGRNGRFLACSGYPDCRATRPIEPKPKLALKTGDDK